MRRVPPLPEVQEESLESAAQGDVIYQLGDKIRLQAKRLSALEQYKLLCEKRIAELAPGHELPVKPEHLGSGSQHSAASQALLKENQSLKQSLREETQKCEQYRSALESLQSHNSPDSVSSLQDRVAQKDRELDTMRRARDALMGELEEIRVALTAMQESCKSLESERESLLSLAWQKEQLETEVRTLREELNTAREELAHMRQTRGADTHTETAQLQVALDVAHNRVAEVSKQNQTLSDELLAMQRMNDAVQEAGRRGQVEIESLRTELEHCKADLEAGSRQRAALQEQLRGSKDAIGERETNESKLKSEVRNLQYALNTAKDEAERAARTHAAKSEEFTRALAASERKIADLEGFYAKKVAEVTNEKNALKERFDTELSSLESAISALETEAKAAKSDAASRIKSSETEIQRLNIRIRELQENLKSEKVAKEQADNDFRQVQSRLSVVSEEKTALVQEIADIRSEQTASKSLQFKLQQTIRSLNEEKSALEKRVESAELKGQEMERLVQGISQENEHLKESLDALQVDLEGISVDFGRKNEEASREREELKAARNREQALSTELSSLLSYLDSKVPSLPLLKPVDRGSRSLQQYFSAIFTCFETVQNDLYALQRECEQLRGSVVSLRAEVDSAKSSLSEALKSERQANEQVSLLSHEMRLLQSRLDETHNSASAHISKVSSELTTFQRENQQLSARLEHATEALSAAESEAMGLKEVISRLKNEVKLREENNAEVIRDRKAVESLLAKVISAIPNQSIRALAVELVQTRSEIATSEKALISTRGEIAEMESRLSALQDSKETIQLHKAIQRKSDEIAELTHSLETLHRKMQTLEGSLEECSATEERKEQDCMELEHMLEDLQDRLDRKTAELTQIRFEMLRTVKNPTSTLDLRATSPRLPQSSVTDRLEQARATISELKKISRSGI